MKKPLFILLIILVVGVGAVGLKQDKGVSPVSDALFGWKYPVAKFPSVGSGDQLAYSDIRDPGGIPQGLPVRLKIPTISVDSAIEDALITPDGRMDVPAGSKNVAWFSLGPHPGQVGSAVIGGHFGISQGVPFVFYNLDKLKIGNQIYVVDDKGNTLTFVVRSIKSFDRNADATTVFTSTDGLAHLNLITCEGIWNKVNDSYPQRLVVFTDAVQEKNLAVPQAETTTILPRPLDIGSRGADVVTLQTTLEQKGFLTMPPGVAKGFFGTLTRQAVAKYQASVGLPADGVFGPLTKARLFLEVAVKPALPSTSKTVSEPVPASAQSASATPFDGLITSFLLLAIGFMIWKIIRR